MSLNVDAPGEAWRFLQGESPCYSKSNQQNKPSVAHMKERRKAAGVDAQELVSAEHLKRAGGHPGKTTCVKRTQEPCRP